jgi:hypothetical protein
MEVLGGTRAFILFTPCFHLQQIDSINVLPILQKLSSTKSSWEKKGRTFQTWRTRHRASSSPRSLAYSSSRVPKTEFATWTSKECLVSRADMWPPSSRM